MVAGPLYVENTSHHQLQLCWLEVLTETVMMSMGAEVWTEEGKNWNYHTCIEEWDLFKQWLKAILCRNIYSNESTVKECIYGTLQIGKNNGEDNEKFTI